MEQADKRYLAWIRWTFKVPGGAQTTLDVAAGFGSPSEEQALETIRERIRAGAQQSRVGGIVIEGQVLNMWPLEKEIPFTTPPN